LQINDLAVIGGSNVKENVRRVMSHVLQHAVALQYNWAGKSGWKSQSEEAKLAFGNLLICSAIKRVYCYTNFLFLYYLLAYSI